MHPVSTALESWLEFRRGESRADKPLVCCDCGKTAEGNVSCDDGDVCDACHAQAMNDTIVER